MTRMMIFSVKRNPGGVCVLIKRSNRLEVYYLVNKKRYVYYLPLYSSSRATLMVIVIIIMIMSRSLFFIYS